MCRSAQGTNFKMKTGFTPDKANDAQAAASCFDFFGEVRPALYFCMQDKTFFNLNNPTEQDRFHWNYTYEAGHILASSPPHSFEHQANSTENPQYKYTFPGGTAWLRRL